MLNVLFQTTGARGLVMIYVCSVDHCLSKSRKFPEQWKEFDTSSWKVNKCHFHSDDFYFMKSYHFLEMIKRLYPGICVERYMKNPLPYIYHLSISCCSNGVRLKHQRDEIRWKYFVLIILIIGFDIVNSII